MKELITIVTEYWKDSHCANAVTKSLLQFNNYSKEPMEILNALTAFGEGMGERSICGAVSGALVSLGILLNENMISTNKINKLADKFKNEFREKNESLYCFELLSPYLDSDEPYPEDPVRLPICTDAVISATKITQKIINEITNSKQRC